MGLQRNAYCIITDSGGVQEESTYFNVLVLLFQKNTERPVTVRRGTNNIIGDDFTKMVKIIRNFNYDKTHNNKKPKLWDGNSSLRIKNHLINYFKGNFNVK